MSETLTLEAEAKSARGTGAARAVRRAGRVPGIVYGGDGEPLMITIEGRVIERHLGRPGFFNHLWDLKVDGRSERVIARDVQRHPVTERAQHVDFLRVAAGARITVDLPVTFVNEERSRGIRRGGMLNVVRHEIEVVCAADAIPAHITVDLAGTDIGDSIHISAVKLPEGVVPTITDRDFTIATIAAPTTVAEETAAATAPEAMPEEGEGEGEEGGESETEGEEGERE